MVTAMYTSEKTTPMPTIWKTKLCFCSARLDSKSISLLMKPNRESFKPFTSQASMETNFWRQKTTTPKKSIAKLMIASNKTISPCNEVTCGQRSRLEISINNQIEIRSPTLANKNARAERLNLTPCSKRNNVRYEAIPAPVATKLDTAFCTITTFNTPG